MNINSIMYYLLMLPGAFFAPVIHEAVKAMVSTRLGDPTPKRNGFLSRNPLRYFETIGFFCMLLFGFGWGQPVPTTPMYYKDRRRDTLVTYITPSAVNLLIGVTAAALTGLLGNILLPGLLAKAAASPGSSSIQITIAEYAMDILLLFARCNIGLAFFNIIPVPPLDGAKILQLVLRPDQAIRVNQYEKILQVLLLICLWMGWISLLFNPLITLIINALI